MVLTNIRGSWCPNCHDEAPILAEVYNKYRSKGLEIVAIGSLIFAISWAAGHYIPPLFGHGAISLGG